MILRNHDQVSPLHRENESTCAIYASTVIVRTIHPMRQQRGRQFKGVTVNLFLYNTVAL